MYSPDTLQRLNEDAVRRYEAKTAAQAAVLAEGGEVPEDEAVLCDYCDKPATHVIPVYNPADACREEPVEGAYSVEHVCDDCYEDGVYLEDCFYCDGCGELFVYNHSWDVVAVTDPESGEVMCQACAAEHMLKPIPLGELKWKLEHGDTTGWLRMNSVPGREKLVELEFSGYSDFPGCTTTGCVMWELEDAAEKAGLSNEDEVYPVITHGYQFSVVLGVFH